MIFEKLNNNRNQILDKKINNFEEHQLVLRKLENNAVEAIIRGNLLQECILSKVLNNLSFEINNERNKMIF